MPNSILWPWRSIPPSVTSASAARSISGLSRFKDRASAGADSRSGFSLVEITLSIGIIAFAFVALLGLIPLGLSTFRDSIDTANETWITQGLHTMVQVTEWPQVRKLGFDESQEIYYFDEEGQQTDSEKAPDSDARVRLKRIYAVKLVVDDFRRPSEVGSGLILADTWRVTALIAHAVEPGSMADFRLIETPGDLSKLPKVTSVRAHSFLVARMDSEKSTP